MYVFEPGAGVSGECLLVEPGFEVKVTDNWFSSLRDVSERMQESHQNDAVINETPLISSCPEVIQSEVKAKKR